MQQHSLLQTKLYIPPIRPELISRPRLIEQLNAGPPTRGDLSHAQDVFPRALTLISAPAGFGKTTLVSEWVQGMGGTTPPIAVAWFSLDEGDNDPARFLAYLIAALRTIEASIGKGVLSALQTPQPPPPEAVLISLLNEIAAIPSRIILVLDDHHTIESSLVDDALAFLLKRLPPQMHLVIITREDPHLPLARMRARGQLTEVRASDLRFTSSEAAQFLNQAMGLDLSADDIAALEGRTEGWIAGLQLAALSLQRHKDATSLIQSFTGSHRFVLDYLVEEVLEQQSESIQTFLMQTAILDRLTGLLCDAVRFGGAESPGSSEGTAVAGPDSGQTILEMLERANLFIVPLDEERRWYRYHHLFADLLRQRLDQTQPEQLPGLHRRASEWCEQNGLIDEAIEHALRAKEFKRSAHLIEEQMDAKWQCGAHEELRHWLDELPVELVLSSPELCIFRAWYLFASGQQDEAERFLQTAESAHDSSTDRDNGTEAQPSTKVPSSNLRMLQGRAAAIRAFMAGFVADVPAIIQQARQALDYLPEQEVTWRSTAAVALGDAYGLRGDMVSAYQARLEASKLCRAAGNIYFLLVANSKLAITMREQGRLKETITICQRQMQIAQESGLSQTGIVGGIMAIWGEALAEVNDLEQARQLAASGAEMTEHGGPLSALGWSHHCLMRVLLSCGDLEGMAELIQKTEKIDRESNIPPWIAKQMTTWQTRLQLAQGELDAASRWTEEGGFKLGEKPRALREIHFFSLMEYVVLTRTLIAQKRLDDAIQLLQLLLETAEIGGRTSRVIEILSLQALAHQGAGDTTRAMDALERALTLAEPEGFVRTFVDEGPPMARLLYEALAREIAPEYARRLLAAFPMPEPEHNGPPNTQSPESDLIEPLSERELEVLQLISEGLTNPEIASRLFLSPHTVKTHARNIYSKLGVHNRTQAVTSARAWGILPST